MDESLVSHLMSAQSAIQEAEVIKPTNSELQAISVFCKDEIKRRLSEAQASDEVKSMRVQQKNLKSKLAKDIQVSAAKCIAISKEDAVRLEAMAKTDNVEPMHPYARIVQVNKDSGITPEIIQEALENVSTEDLAEAAAGASAEGTATTKTTVRHLVMTKIRRIIRSYTESLKMSESLPRGLSIYDVAQASKEVADRMWQLWITEQSLKKNLLKKKNASMASVSSSNNTLKTQIEAFFMRTGLTAQRIVVEGHPYRLVRRISVRKPKIGVGRFEQILDGALADSSLDDLKAFRPIEFMKELQVQLSSVPAETKSNVVLCKIAEDKIEDK